MNTPSINTLLDELWKSGQAPIHLSGSDFTAAYKRTRAGAINVTIAEGDTLVGYATLHRDDRGWYQVVHYPDIDGVFPGLKNGFGVGIEIRPEYRGRHAGHALLSLGVGLAQREFEKRGWLNFEVRANGLGDREDFFRKFGFAIARHDLGGKRPYSVGVYTNPTSVPAFGSAV